MLDTSSDAGRPPSEEVLMAAANSLAYCAFAHGFGQLGAVGFPWESEVQFDVGRSGEPAAHGGSGEGG